MSFSDSNNPQVDQDTEEPVFQFNPERPKPSIEREGPGKYVFTSWMSKTGRLFIILDYTPVFLKKGKPLTDKVERVCVYDVVKELPNWIPFPQFLEQVNSGLLKRADQSKDPIIL